MNLAGKVSNQLGETQSGLTVELYEAATWEAGGIATASTTTNANGNWAFTAIDPTKTWTVVAISGSKRIVIDAQASIQLTQLEVITNISVDTINERILHAGVTADGVLLKDSQVSADVINEKTLHAGVTIDGVLLKDGFVVDAAIPAGIARDAEVDSNIGTKIGTHETGSRHRWTLDKLRKGAGPGADPTEIDIPGGADYPMKQKPAIVRWVIPGWQAVSTLNTVVIAGRIYYTPIFVSEITTYIRIGCNVSGASAGLADLRIFNWADGLPGSLVLAAGTIDTGTPGNKEIIISQQLTRGYYFLAIRTDATPILQGISFASQACTPVAGIANDSLIPGGVILVADAAYADPAPSPTGIVALSSSFVRLREN